MGRPRVERRIEEFRARVVKAAAELFATQGIEATKLDDICEAADVAKRTLSNHFATKAEIVDAVVEGAVTAMVGLVETARRQGTSTRERLGLLFDGLRRADRLLDTRPTAVHPDFAVGLFRHPGSSLDSAQREIRLSDAVRELLAEGGPAQLPPGVTAPVLTDVVLGSIYSVTLESSFRDETDGDAQLVGVRDFLVGLIPEPERASRRTPAHQGELR